MNEFELIAHLAKSLPANDSVVAGAGDDCAVLDLGVPDKLILFKTDAVVEGVHFTRETPPEKIGRKALARCLSDLAAMAGTPTAALVTMALPEKFEVEFVSGIYSGLNELAEKYGVAVVGGETTSNPGRMLISIALLGTVPRGKQILRRGAKVGDAIFVTGELGGSLAGRHLEFEPRLAEARWLAEHFHVHAMMDLSDGLAGDLRHLTAASQVESSRASVRLAQVNRDLAQKQLDAEQKKYDLGTTVIFFVLDAQQRLVNAEADLVNQSVAYRRNLITFLNATGELLAERGVAVQ